MDKQAPTIGMIDLLASGAVVVRLNGKPEFHLSTLCSIDLLETIREQSRLDQRKRDREKLVSERLANISFRPQIGILQSEDE